MNFLVASFFSASSISATVGISADSSIVTVWASLSSFGIAVVLSVMGVKSCPHSRRGHAGNRPAFRSTGDAGHENMALFVGHVEADVSQVLVLDTVLVRLLDVFPDLQIGVLERAPADVVHLQAHEVALP